MHRPKLGVAISPCPNDVFIFSGILLKSIETSLDLSIDFYDIGELNSLALKGRYSLIKGSFVILPHVANSYQVLDFGAALGYGAGPVLVARRLPHPETPKVGLPGPHTTATFLFDLFIKIRHEKVYLPFHEIIPKLKKGELDLGVLIHEGRFVFESHGLKLVADLGKLWEKEHSLPLPLGGLFIKSDLSSEIKNEVLSTLRKSLQFAEKNWEFILPLLKDHAQELDEDTIKRHVQTFVNDYTKSLGQDGVEAIGKLLSYSTLKDADLNNLFWGNGNGHL